MSNEAVKMYGAVELKAPGIIERTSVKEPVITGIVVGLVATAFYGVGLLHYNSSMELVTSLSVAQLVMFGLSMTILVYLFTSVAKENFSKWRQVTQFLSTRDLCLFGQSGKYTLAHLAPYWGIANFFFLQSSILATVAYTVHRHFWVYLYTVVFCYILHLIIFVVNNRIDYIIRYTSDDMGVNTSNLHFLSVCGPYVMNGMWLFGLVVALKPPGIYSEGVAAKQVNLELNSDYKVLSPKLVAKSQKYWSVEGGTAAKAWGLKGVSATQQVKDLYFYTNTMQLDPNLVAKAQKYWLVEGGPAATAWGLKGVSATQQVKDLYFYTNTMLLDPNIAEKLKNSQQLQVVVDNRVALPNPQQLQVVVDNRVALPNPQQLQVVVDNRVALPNAGAGPVGHVLSNVDEKEALPNAGARPVGRVLSNVDEKEALPNAGARAIGGYANNEDLNFSQRMREYAQLNERMQYEHLVAQRSMAALKLSQETTKLLAFHELTPDELMTNTHTHNDNLILFLKVNKNDPVIDFNKIPWGTRDDWRLWRTTITNQDLFIKNCSMQSNWLVDNKVWTKAQQLEYKAFFDSTVVATVEALKVAWNQYGADRGWIKLKG